MLRKELKILFIRQGSRSFFETDLKILETFSKAVDFDNYPPSLLKIPALIQHVLWCDLVYVWFMGRHSVAALLLARLLGKKVILVAGGWDVANCPEIGYGLMRPGITAVFSRSLFKIPDLILSVSDSNHKELLKNTGVSEWKAKRVYHGFKDYDAAPGMTKAKMVVTIGEVNKSNLKRKGLELFVNTAKEMPDIPFIVIGKWASDGAAEYLKRIAPSNVQFTGHLTQGDKDQFLDRAMVYAQLSFHEAFGCAVAEAMQHGCIPVVTNQFALPEVVGDAGIVVNRDLESVKRGVLQALCHPEPFQPAQRVRREFSYERRSKEIRRLVSQFL